jgi:hypothetical protein
MAPPPVVIDFCENALPLAVGAKVFANMTYATSDIVDDDCLDIAIYENFPGVWYKFVGNGKRLEARSCTGNNLFPKTITILEGGCSTTNLKCVAGTRTPCGLEHLSFDAVEGTTYYILLRSDLYYTDDDSSIAGLSISTGAPVPNDFCTNTQSMSIGSTVRGDLSFATAEKEYDYSSCFRDLSSAFSYPDVWYTFIGNGKQLSAHLGPLCARSEDTAILILTGGCNVTNLNCVAEINYHCRRGHLLFDTVKDTRYHVLVKSNNIDRIVR